MNFIEKLDGTLKRRPSLVSVILAAIAIYPHLVTITMQWKIYSEHGKPLQYFAITPIRFCLFFLAALVCLIVNFRKVKTRKVWNFARLDFLVCLAVIPLFYLIVKGLRLQVYQFSIIYFEALILWILVFGISYMDVLLEGQRNTEKQMEELQMENMKSRYAALLNQINPHFFFNSLNGLSSLVRKKDDAATLRYIEEMSDIFRYTLQDEPLEVVPMESEIDFARQYLDIFSKRYANKVTVDIDVPEDMGDSRLPVLSLLPLLENISTHNIIDSEHRMEVRLRVNDGFLEVSNLKFPKLNPPRTTGTGLGNLSSRFQMITGKDIETVDDGRTFTVRLPIIDEPE